MLKTTSLAALVAGGQVPLVPGDTLRVICKFTYTVAQTTTEVLWGALGIGLGRDIESFKYITLDKALTPTTWEGDIDIPIPMSGKNNGAYWLQVEVKDYDLGQQAGQKIEGAVVISGMPEVGDVFNVLEMIPLLVMVMMMSMMMNIMGGLTKEA